jgi:5-formyltetrahydrofolate cyclo-ligase
MQAAQLPTIFPQTYDIAMDAIVTEAGVHNA